MKISREALERDGEVRRHEKAHMAALGSAADSGIIYNTMKGPGGESIAVGGKIAVDLSEVPGDPAATLSKAPYDHLSRLCGGKSLDGRYENGRPGLPHGEQGPGRAEPG